MMLIAIGLFFSVVALLLIGYIGEVISGAISKASQRDYEEESSIEMNPIAEY